MDRDPLLAGAEVTVDSLTAGRCVRRWSVRRRARRGLRPVEAALVARYRPELSGRVLEIGSRGDGMTDVLAHHAAQLSGIALSAREADLCRRRFPHSVFLLSSLAVLNLIESESLDAIVAGHGALHRLSEDRREVLLTQARELLAPGGVMLFSLAGQYSVLRGDAGAQPLPSADGDLV